MYGFVPDEIDGQNARSILFGLCLSGGFNSHPTNQLDVVPCDGFEVGWCGSGLYARLDEELVYRSEFLGWLGVAADALPVLFDHEVD